MQNAADKMVRELLGMATNPNVSDPVELAAIRDALDRAGLKPATIVDLELNAKPWESVFEEITEILSGPTRTHHRTHLGDEAAPGEVSEDPDEIEVLEDPAVEICAYEIEDVDSSVDEDPSDDIDVDAVTRAPTPNPPRTTRSHPPAGHSAPGRDHWG